jgi:hypothetical protein
MIHRLILSRKRVLSSSIVIPVDEAKKLPCFSIIKVSGIYIRLREELLSGKRRGCRS